MPRLGGKEFCILRDVVMRRGRVAAPALAPISESDRPQTQIRVRNVECPPMSDAADLKTQMNQLIRGYWTTQAIFVAAELGIEIGRAHV